MGRSELFLSICHPQSAIRYIYKTPQEACSPPILAVTRLRPATVLLKSQPQMSQQHLISVGSYVIVDGNPQKRALVECQGDAADSWDVYYEEEGVEEDGVPVSRLQYDQNQPKKKTDKEVMASVSFLIQSRKGNVDVPDEMWRLQTGRTQNKAEAGAGADADADEGGRVYLGSMHTSKNQQLLQKHGITHIVNCTCDLPNHFEPPRSVGVTYLRFDEIDIFSTSFVGTLIQMQKKKDIVNKKRAFRLGGITCCCRECAAAESSFEREQHQQQQPTGDAGDNILLFFKPLFDFIDEAVSGGGNVLIHCVAGAHRAGTSTCAYLMHRDKTMSPDEAIAYCKVRRPIVDPAISPRLVNLLDNLYAAHRGTPIATTDEVGVAAAAAAAPAIDLNAEGRKVLAACSC